MIPENLSILNRQPTLQILPIFGLQVGKLMVEVVTTGTEVTAVRYEVDKKRAGRDDTAPWRFPVDLGQEPRPHSIRAIALNRKGEAIASDSVSINIGGQVVRSRVHSYRFAAKR